MPGSASWITPRPGLALVFQTWLVYVNRVGSEDGVLFAGGSRVVDPFGCEAGALTTARDFDDPELLTELSQARELGLKGEKSANFPPELQKRFPKWKVTRIESNLKVIRVASPGQGGAGGPGE